jgi:membrane protein required for colicin V production
MIDIIVLVLFAALMARGWARGLVREAVDVGALILGAVLAFRLAPAAGSLLHNLLEISPDMARVIGGAVLFIGVAVAAGVLGSAISKSITYVPGIAMLNRVGGAVLGALYTAVLVVIAVTLISAAPLPGVAQAHVDMSMVVDYVTQPDGTAQRAMRTISGDRALQSMIWIRDTVDGWVLDPSVTDVTFPGDGDGGDAHVSSSIAAELLDQINERRAVQGLAPLAYSETLSLLAATRAMEVYRTGDFAEQQPLSERLASVNASSSSASEYMVLAPTIGGLSDAADADGAFVDVGIGVVDGPYGLLAVVIQTS